MERVWRRFRYALESVSLAQGAVLLMLAGAPVTGQEVVDWYMRQSDLTLLLSGIGLAVLYFSYLVYGYNTLPISVDIPSGVSFKRAGWSDSGTSKPNKPDAWFATITVDDLSLKNPDRPARLGFRLFLKEKGGGWSGPYDSEPHKFLKPNVRSSPADKHIVNYIRAPVNLGAGESLGIDGKLAFKVGTSVEPPEKYRRDRARLEIYERGTKKMKTVKVPNP